MTPSLTEKNGTHDFTEHFAKDVHPRGFNSNPPMFVAEIIKELLEVLGVVNLVDDLLDGAEDVHAVPVEVLAGFQFINWNVGLLSEH